MQFSRLLEPIKANPLPYLKAIFSRCVIISVEISGILVIQKIAQGAQEGNIHLIQQWSIFLIGVVIVSLLFKRSIRHWFWPNSTAVSEQYLWHRYFHAVIQLDSTHVEKLGTGRMIDIVHAGIKAWTTMLELFCLGLADIGLKLGFACYMVAQISVAALGLFLVLLITMFVIVVYINTFALASRA